MSEDFNVGEYLLAGPWLKSVAVVGKPGAYGWSKRLRAAANCIIARWEGGDQISDRELGWHLGQFVMAGKITEAQRNEFYRAIGRLDGSKGGTEDLQSMRAFAKILGMRVIVRASEPPLPAMKPGAYSMTYQQAYRLASFIKKSTQGLEVRVARTDEKDHGPPTASWWRSPPGSYTVKVGPPGMGN